MTGLAASGRSGACASCRHLDADTNGAGLAYCWWFYAWRDPVASTCLGAAYERADGREPPFKIHFSPRSAARGNP